MSDPNGVPRSPRDGNGTAETSAPSVVREEAGAVTEAVADAARDVAGAATEQAAQVTQQAQRHLEDLVEQARAQVTDQARQGQHKAGESLRGVAQELRQMADSSQDNGPVAGIAAQVADRVGDMARWLDHHEPHDVLREVRGLARRRPGAFLAGAALAGVLAGRLTRGTVDPDPADNTDRGSGFPDAPAPATSEKATARAPRSAVPEDELGPEHEPRSGATTVGEYVEELERRGELEYPPAVGTT